jgi:hypothetical protein
MVLGPFASPIKVAPFGTHQATSSAAGTNPGNYHLRFKRSEFVRIGLGEEVF